MMKPEADLTLLLMSHFVNCYSSQLRLKRVTIIGQVSPCKNGRSRLRVIRTVSFREILNTCLCSWQRNNTKWSLKKLTWQFCDSTTQFSSRATAMMSWSQRIHWSPKSRSRSHLSSSRFNSSALGSGILPRTFSLQSCHKVTWGQNIRALNFTCQ